MTIRPATTADAAAVLGLMRELYEHEGIPFDRAISEIALGTLLSAPTLGEVGLMHADGEVLGYFVVTLGFSLEFHGRFALLDEMYIRDEYRSRGLGRQALKAVESMCRERGIAALRLEVEQSNLHAQSLYRSSGFESHNRQLMTKWL